jgi:hypothetical protein
MAFEPGLWGDLKPDCDIVSETNLTQERPPADNVRYSFHINRQGFRGREVAAADTAWKALILGDGYAFGMGVNEGQDIASRLEEELRKAYPWRNSVVINAGMGGYTITDELSYLREKGRLISPRLVVVILARDDVWEIKRPVVLRDEYKRMARSPWEQTRFEEMRKKHRLFSFKEQYLKASGLGEEAAYRKLVGEYVQLAMELRDEARNLKSDHLFVLFESEDRKLFDAMRRERGLNCIFVESLRTAREDYLPDGHFSARMCARVASQILQWMQGYARARERR